MTESAADRPPFRLWKVGQEPPSIRIANRAKKAAKDTVNNPTVRANAKWAKNTIIGTAKGVTIAAVATTAGEGIKSVLGKGLKHKKR